MIQFVQKCKEIFFYRGTLMGSFYLSSSFDGRSPLYRSTYWQRKNETTLTAYQIIHRGFILKGSNKM